ncbi:chemotaxis protein CheW [Lacrimispora sp.]|jgi:purine-binding chemotaxis protein CheW|uniref:chemotaxis protein CheW n=1 Tax=Lacrimispora sp. TaxID=2719234 RepID=UPI0029E747EE|nr:purine-binding chemotaxis protein CheW [Lacrimispora sp.]
MSAESTKTAMSSADNLSNDNIVSEATEAMERYLTFRTDNLIFGVSTNYIIEIITNHVITAMPMMPNYVKGIINLRGQIVPIIDIRLRLGKPAIEYTSTTCVIVLNVDSVYIGIIVDAVEQVLDIDYSRISSVPASNREELVSGMISMPDNKVVLLLDCVTLVNNS